jgi:hypothetical protein
MSICQVIGHALSRLSTEGMQLGNLDSDIVPVKKAARVGSYYT